MVPVLELRGAIPFGVANGLPHWIALLVAVAGNILPVPFILLFIRKIFAFLSEKSQTMKKIVDWLENHARKKGSRVYTSAVLGLLLLVAIPLPGTGAWTGALVASVFDIRIRVAFPVISLGVFIAGVVTTIITYGVGALIT
ncbi:MAG: small multi-drug export protein [Clostridia bacterium]|nr:small multi-drug export protein [Clostridia bacterium]